MSEVPEHDEPYPGEYQARLGCRMVALLYDPGSRSGAIWIAHGERANPERARAQLEAIDPEVEDVWVIEAPAERAEPGAVLFVYSSDEEHPDGEWLLFEGAAANEMALEFSVEREVPQFVYVPQFEEECEEAGADQSADELVELGHVH